MPFVYSTIPPSRRVRAYRQGFLLYRPSVSNEALGLRDRALGDFHAAIVLLPQFPNSYGARAPGFSGDAAAVSPSVSSGP